MIINNQTSLGCYSSLNLHQQCHRDSIIQILDKCTFRSQLNLSRFIIQYLSGDFHEVTIYFSVNVVNYVRYRAITCYSSLNLHQQCYRDSII